MERVSKKTSAGARQDYIWRYLCERYLIRYQKYFAHSWKQTFWRNEKATLYMTTTKKDLYDYKMCPIRHFKTHLVKFIDAC